MRIAPHLLQWREAWGYEHFASEYREDRQSAASKTTTEQSVNGREARLLSKGPDFSAYSAGHCAGEASSWRVR
jgi:hypothetical protein